VALDNNQKKKLVKGLGKLLSAVVKGAAQRNVPKNTNLGAPVPPPQPGCGACGPRHK
jgi:hypothetical protein